MLRTFANSLPLIDLDIRQFPQCIMGNTVLGTLEEMNLVKIHTYNKFSEKPGRDYKLVVNENSTFDLLTDATWQMRSIERIYQEKALEEREKKKKDNDK